MLENENVHEIPQGFNINDFFVDQPKLLGEAITSPRSEVKFESVPQLSEIEWDHQEFSSMWDQDSHRKSKRAAWESTPEREDKVQEPSKLYPLLAESPVSDHPSQWDETSKLSDAGSQSENDGFDGGLMSLRPNQSILSKKALMKLKSHFISRSQITKRKVEQVDQPSKRLKPFFEDEKSRAAYHIATRLVKGSLLL
eukprot:CAMPEP_0184478592 /NCGR_PEP_ID=MMETSP0113_2-20130426/575_1 /TAXON_ID=91329 /ORGANISM="Norrisiella sphaerica, Strain BC52" /LENGTH=196 /DNA_ID=CAMNT_0026856441 /DNA_START=202 /DNA_END=792 /DNA_ORIENTATION=-